MTPHTQALFSLAVICALMVCMPSIDDARYKGKPIAAIANAMTTFTAFLAVVFILIDIWRLK